MRLDHEFTVPAPIDEVWQALLDPERVAPCMPGATLTGVDGDEFTATMKVKLGPVSLQYKGTGEFVEKDTAARRLVIKASGKDARGGGTASATVTVTLTDGSGTTTGSVATDMTVTGRPAQFGRGMISEVGGRLLGDFSSCLSERLGPAAAPAPVPEPAAEAAAAGGPSVESGAATGTSAADPAKSRTESEAAPIDLMDVAGAPVLKRVAPVVVALGVLAAIIVIVRACRK